MTTVFVAEQEIAEGNSKILTNKAMKKFGKIYEQRKDSGLKKKIEKIKVFKIKGRKGNHTLSGNVFSFPAIILLTHLIRKCILLPRHYTFNTPYPEMYSPAPPLYF